MGDALNKKYLTKAYLSDVIQRALREDLGDCGDVTSASIFEPSDKARAVIRAKSPGVVAGTFLLRPLFRAVDPRVRVSGVINDGTRVEAGDEVCRVSGPIQAILSGERIALNFLQRLSGIATATNILCSKISHTGTVLLDTRKTTPCLRPLERAAVLAGGGANHRFGLFDLILIKDTHVKAAGGVTAALKAAISSNRHRKRKVRVEVEVQSVEECAEAIALNPDVIMLDNMTTPSIKKCVALAQAAGGGTKLEASGNVTGRTIRKIAETGVDYISVGSITHSAPSMDIHLVISDMYSEK